MISFMAHGLPVAQGSKVMVGKGDKRMLVEGNRAKLRPWRQELSQLAAEEMRGDRPLSGPVSVRIMFFLPRPKGHFGTGRNAERVREGAPIAPHTKPDIDKLARSVLDALSGVVFLDDAQVVDLSVSKLYADDSRYPGAMVEIRMVV
jgi:Holliday junction resolvase RusA-like endonuclease